MGQRSQIYIRHNGKLIVANYYQWNYGERMVSRARSIIEYIKCRINYIWLFESAEDIETLKRFCDINFDMRDISRHSDIFAEYESDKGEEWCPKDACYYFYKWQDNNDGKLFIDISGDQIKYAFTDSDADSVMSARQYADWNIVGWSYRNDKYFGNEERATLLTNIDSINQMAKLMNAEDLADFLATDPVYSEANNKV